jgi:hypothetical protein
MATNTYVALDTQTLSSAAASVTFSSISGAYTDLVMVINTTGISASGSAYAAQFNGDTAGNYSATSLTGNGTSAVSDRTTSTDNIQVGAGSTGSGTGYETLIINFPNYSNTTTYKTALARWSAAAVGTSAQVGTWRSTAAINSIKIYLNNVKTFSTGSTFTLYGIANTEKLAPKAFGGIVTQDATYTYHTFRASGTFTPQQSLTCDYLVVAGGGGSGGTNVDTGSGGGGAGGLRSTVTATGGGGTLESAIAMASATNYAITIGAGGAGGVITGNTQGTSGVASSIIGGVVSISSTGGGGGGANSSGGTGPASNGATGGSGGGASRSGTAGSGTANQGYAGGGAASNGLDGSGGGGAGGAGITATASGVMVGGAGVAITALATPTGTGILGYYAGGGGGGAYDYAVAGTATAGGGNGGRRIAGTVGVANTGGGGGGTGGNGAATAAGASGGSGIVIIRYAN